MARVGLRRVERVGFIVALLVGYCLSDPLSSDASTSAATPPGSSQLVASSPNRDQGVEPVKSPTPESGDNKKPESEAASSASQPPPASEVGDLMRDPYHNITVSISDRDEEAMINNETDIIYDPHVNRLNKTHEEEGAVSSTQAPLDLPTQQSREVQDSSPSSTTERSTSSDDVTEKETYSEKNSNEEKPTEKGGSVSLAEVTSLPALALVSQHDHSATSKTAALHHTTQAAAILAGVLVLVAIMGYLGLLLWRRVLEKRYGNREMLVNEDDDFKHFEL